MNVMEKHLVSWQEVTELQRKYDLFVKNLQKIENAVRVLDKEVSPLKEKRADSRKKLVEQLFPVTGVMGVYAYDTGDKKLRKLADRKFSEMEEMKSGALDLYSGRVLKKAGQLMAMKKEDSKKSPGRLITEYGLTQDHLERLRSAREASARESASVKQLKSDREQNSRILGKAIRENDQLLKRRIDRMIHLFRDTAPVFYTEYQEARGGGGKAPVKARKTAPVKAGKPPATGKSAATAEPASAGQSATTARPASAGKAAAKGKSTADPAREKAEAPKPGNVVRKPAQKRAGAGRPASGKPRPPKTQAPKTQGGKR